jgi:fumarylacetoacetate (FAA) hydrolase
MRFASVVDPRTGQLRPVAELPERGRVALDELFGHDPPPFAADMKLAVEHLDQISRAVEKWNGHREGDLSAAPLLPPIPQPATFRDFYAFEQHVSRCRAKRGLPMDTAWYEQPAFYFSNPVALVGHEAAVHAPDGSEELDFELELGLIVGQGGRNVSRAQAWEHVAGFTIVNDFSARDLQRREMSVGLGPAKGKDFATAVGPWLVTLDEVRDRIDDRGRLHLRMAARVNGRELSRGDSADMYFTWPQIIEHASRDAQLLAGDLLGSGTVGTGCILELGPENTGGWLKPGDVVELEIERLGVLRTGIVRRDLLAPSPPVLRGRGLG